MGAVLPPRLGFVASQGVVMGPCRARGPLRAMAPAHTAEGARGACVGEAARARELEEAAGQGLCQLAQQFQEWFVFGGE